MSCGTYWHEKFVNTTASDGLIDYGDYPLVADCGIPAETVFDPKQTVNRS
jgi:hypothetical protein